MELPNLLEIKSFTLNGIRVNDFTLTVNLKAQKGEVAPTNKKAGA
jgi:hypothetical protein